MQGHPSGWASSDDDSRDGHRIAFVLGKPPRGSSILPEVMGGLEQRGFEVAIHLPHEAPETVPVWLFHADLVVQRGLDGSVLKDIRRLEDAGVRCCNPVGATMEAQDRFLFCRRLAGAHLPVPETTVANTWADVAAARGRAVVVKARDAARGRGAGVLRAPDGALPASEPFPGPYVVQDFVPADEWIRKLYVAGGDVRGLLKPGSERAASVGPAVPLRPTAALTDLGLRVGPALGLEIYGVDLIAGPAGPLIIDVNPFPGFRGVSGAAGLIADLISTLSLSPRSDA